jgi:hypothetical protein
MVNDKEYEIGAARTRRSRKNIDKIRPIRQN